MTFLEQGVQWLDRQSFCTARVLNASTMGEPIASELQPYRKLKTSRGIVLAAVADELPEICRSRREVRVGREYGSVQRIECFKAELGRHAFADARGFDGGGVVCRGPSIAQVAPT